MAADLRATPSAATKLATAAAASGWPAWMSPSACWVWASCAWASAAPAAAAMTTHGSIISHGSTVDDEQIYCSECQMWLNGTPQWEDHRKGDKHKKHKALNKKIAKQKILAKHMQCRSCGKAVHG